MSSSYAALIFRIFIILMLASTILLTSNEGTNNKRRHNVLILAFREDFSHVALNVHLANILANAGHSVWIVINRPTLRVDAVGNTHSLFAHTTSAPSIDRNNDEERKSEGLLPQISVFYVNFPKLFMPNKTSTPGKAKQAQKMERLRFKLISQFKQFLADEALVAQLRAQQFDVGIAEIIDRSAFPVLHHLGVRVTVATSAIALFPANLHWLGVPSLGTVPDFDSHQSFDGKAALNVTQRSEEILYSIRNRVTAEKAIFDEMDKVTQTVTGDPRFPRMLELLRRPAFYFQNMLEPFDFPRPLHPKVRFFGGIHFENSVVANSRLSKRNDVALNSPPDTILCSFGSLSRAMLAGEKLSVLAETFAHFSHIQFEVKITTNEERNALAHLQNVRTSFWVNQRSLLESGRVRAFISHCGQNSVLEAIAAGVPLLCIPGFGDQFYNAAVVESRRLGVVLEQKAAFSSFEKLAHAIEELLRSNNRYSKNARAMRNAFLRMPFRPEEVFLKTIESLPIADENVGGDGEQVPGGDNIPGLGTSQLEYFYEM